MSVCESVFAEATSRGRPHGDTARRPLTGEADASSQGPEVSSPSDENRPCGISWYFPEQEMFYLFIYDVCSFTWHFTLQLAVNKPTGNKMSMELEMHFRPRLKL